MHYFWDKTRNKPNHFNFYFFEKLRVSNNRFLILQFAFSLNRKALEFSENFVL